MHLVGVKEEQQNGRPLLQIALQFTIYYWIAYLWVFLEFYGSDLK
jgi:hypothetical protein